MVEKCLKDWRVGNARIILGGTVFTKDDHGREIPHPCGLLWKPWEHEEGRTVAALNSITIEGDPGDKISVRVFAVSLKDRKVLEELKPTFANSAKEIWVWEYKAPITVFINGERDAENWTVSHWRMLSGRVDFDIAKNKIHAETQEEAKAPEIDISAQAEAEPDDGNGHGEQPEIAGPDPKDIAGQQAGLNQRPIKGNGRDKRREARA